MIRCWKASKVKPALQSPKRQRRYSMGAESHETDSIGLLLAQFQISGAKLTLDRLEKQAQAESWSYRRYLREILENEAQARRERRLRRLMSEAQLPEGKTLASLQAEVLSAENRRQLHELCEGHFVDRAENVL